MTFADALAERQLTFTHLEHTHTGKYRRPLLHRCAFRFLCDYSKNMELHKGTTKVNSETTLHYETRGTPRAERPSLVFLHYYGGSPRTWDPLLAQPALKDFFTVCYHARGWAPSTGPDDPKAYSIAHMSADLAALVAATGVDRAERGFVLVGHSMGGKVAQHYAATSPEARLAGMVLVAPAPLRGLEFPPEAKKQMLEAYQSAESVRFVLDNVLTAGSGALSETLAAQCVEHSLRGNEWATRAWPEYCVGEDYEALSKEISAPVLVLRGDKDFERDAVGPIEGGGPSKWVNKDIEHCGHLIPLEQPQQLAAEMLAFLKNIT